MCFQPLPSPQSFHLAGCSLESYSSLGAAVLTDFLVVVFSVVFSSKPEIESFDCGDWENEQAQMKQSTLTDMMMQCAGRSVRGSWNQCICWWVGQGLVTIDQGTDSSTHLDMQNKQHHVSSNSQFNLYSPKALYILLFCFQEQHSHMFCLLSEEAFLYAGAAWLNSYMSVRGWQDDNSCSCILH